MQFSFTGRDIWDFDDGKETHIVPSQTAQLKFAHAREIEGRERRERERRGEG